MAHGTECETVMPRPYETGMKVTYDLQTKRVIVTFRGRIVVLPESAKDEAAAIAAGEAYCRAHGWTPPERNTNRHTVRSAW